MKLQFRWQDSSTKRGLALLVTGGMALGQLLAEERSWALLTQEAFWLALGATLSGLIGVCVPDPPERKEPPP